MELIPTNKGKVYYYAAVHIESGGIMEHTITSTKTDCRRALKNILAFNFDGNWIDPSKYELSKYRISRVCLKEI